MTEHTDKSLQKSARTPPRKRPAKARSRGGKRGGPPEQKDSGHENPEGQMPGAAGDVAPGGVPHSPPAPDPASVVFGSNRPIAAPPPKLPQGSGLRFSGPSDGVLKASGPQPTSPKASGLTFTTAKDVPAQASPTKTAPAKAGATKTSVGKPAAAPAAKPAAKPVAGPDTAGKPDTRKPDIRQPEAGKPEGSSAEAKKPALTKPAIAPQASGRRFHKDRPVSGLIAILLVLTVVGSGLAFWIKLDNETAPRETPEPQVAAEPAPAPAPDPMADTPVVASRPAARAEETREPPPAGEGVLSPAEIDEVQRLLVRLDFDPGHQAGVLTPETAAAIRNYQEMAGLPVNGRADKALLEELRSVAEIYGG